MIMASDYSILAVDDTDIILELLQTQLGKEGYQVVTSNDAEKAMQLVTEARFDLILLDIEMPGMSGIELLKFIKNDTINNQTPVIMLTAQSDSEHVTSCLNNGARDYILKPINMVSVKQRIWKALHR